MPAIKTAYPPNEQQKKVVEHTEGPLLVIAGPGSGKTFTLVERTAHLITQKNLEPENLLISTFTEKAAKELITRISNRLIESGLKFNVNEMYVGTIHSTCLRFLEENREFTRLGKNYSIMDQFDQQYFFYQRMKEYDTIPNISLICGDSDTSRWRRSESLLKWINKISEENIKTDALADSGNPQLKALADAYSLYQKQLEETGRIYQP